jgi:hypothetical protein
MSIHIIYDHSNLSMRHLHAAGIRSTKELEEVIESRISYCSFNGLFNDFPAYLFLGLTRACKGLEIVLTVDDSGKYITMDAQIPQPEELLFYLCKKRKL